MQNIYTAVQVLEGPMVHMPRCQGQGPVGPTPGGGLSTDTDTGADTAEGEMRRGGASGAPGDRGGGDGRVMEDVMCSDPGHQPHKAASVASKRPRQELPSISLFTTLDVDDAAVWEPGFNGICRTRLRS